MLEPLPLEVQNQVAEHIQEYLIDLRDEAPWDEAFHRTQDSLVAAARRAKQEITEGQAKPMDYEKLTRQQNSYHLT